MTPSLLKTEYFTAGDIHPHDDELRLGANLELCLMEKTASKISVDESYNRLVIERVLAEDAGLFGRVCIYRGHLAREKHAVDAPDDPDELVLPIIVKASRTEPEISSEQLVVEARFYVTHLAAAVSQGLVPACYGVFSTKQTEDDEEGLTCLVLEDCGDDLTSEWDTLKNTRGLEFKPSKHQLMKTVFDLHNLGVIHGSIDPHHITRRDQRRTPCIIDFSCAEAGMQCSCQSKTIEALHEIVVKPWREAFGCDELWELCQSLEVWAPRMFMCFGVTFYVEWCDNLERVALQKPTFMDWDEALRKAYMTVNKFLKKWYSGSADDLRIQATIDSGELDTLCARYKEKMDSNPPSTE
ncbi:hypothetical protein PENSPDRAFT_756925 [Peniophora sp. CONT]|nr:hypothetical protein PENSPDRAFT_756925 [Peniophora sp. CONT]